MTDQEYLEILHKHYKRLTSDKKIHLKMIDSNFSGDHHTEVNWGFCSEELEIWDDPKCHKWPDQLEKYQRSSPKDQNLKQFCPFDGLTVQELLNELSNNDIELKNLIQHHLKFLNQNEISRSHLEGYTFGCFYRCFLFQNQKEVQKFLTPQLAAKAYLARMKKFQEQRQIK